MWTRRESIRTLVGTVAGLGVGAVRAESQPIAARIIDTHTHFYDPSRPQGVPWPGKGGPLYRPVYPKDWAALAGPLGIRQTLVVEASPWFEDNQWLLDLATKETSIVGVVGNLEFGHPEFSRRLRALASNPLFRGVRLSGKALAAVIATRELWDGLKLLAELDLALDINGEFGAISGMLATVPNLRVVLNHVGSSGPPDRLRVGWREEIQRISAEPNVRCKVSGLVEQSGAASGMALTSTEHYLPILDHVSQCFGPDRLLYGSNWPVSDNGADYAGVFNVVTGYFRLQGQEICDKVFYKNAKAAYKVV